MTASTKRIAIIDDHDLFLQGLGLIIAGEHPEYEVCTFSSPKEFFLQTENQPVFDLLISDLVMNEMNGMAVLSALRNRGVTIPVLIVSGISNVLPVHEIKELGGNGFVHKSSDKETLLAAIDHVIARKTGFFSVDAGTVGGEEDFSTQKFPKLSQRQLEILKLVCDGLTNSDIAMQLDISENTVKTHLKTLFYELGVNRRAACVQKAQAFGLV